VRDPCAMGRSIAVKAPAAEMRRIVDGAVRAFVAAYGNARFAYMTSSATSTALGPDLPR
jgi:hypothetical protein